MPAEQWTATLQIPLEELLSNITSTNAVTFLASPCPLSHGQHTQNTTWQQCKFPVLVVWTTSPGLKVFVSLSNAFCNAGPAVWLIARAIAPMDRFKFDPTEHTKMSACLNVKQMEWIKIYLLAILWIFKRNDNISQCRIGLNSSQSICMTFHNYHVNLHLAI